MLYIVGAVIYLGLILAAIAAGGSLAAFIDIPSIMIVIGGTFAVTIISYSLEDIDNALKSAFSGVTDVTKLKMGAYFWLSQVRILLGVGAVGTIIGWIKMLQNLSDPNGIGPAMAIGLLTFFYGLLITFLLPIPAYHIIRRKIAGMEPTSKSEGE